MSGSSDAVIADWLHDRTAPVIGWAQRHPHELDVLTASLIAVASLIEIALQGHRLQRPDVVVFCFALPAPLLTRTVDRRLAFVLVALVALVQWIISTPQLADGAVLVALFWVALDGELTEMALAGVVAEAGAVMAAARWSPHQPVKVWVGVTGLWVAAGGLGIAIRQRRALVASMQERAARLELQRDQEGRLGAVGERARIAREMHDIVSHNLTVMIGLADGAVYALHGAPETSLAAMARVAGTGREALDEMRRLLGVLREQPVDGPYEPQPGLDRLDDLLGRVDVLVEVEGGEDDDPGYGAGSDDAAGRLDAVEHRHPHVHERDIGRQARDSGDRVLPVGGLPDHLEVRLAVDHHTKPHPHELLVVGKQHADHRARAPTATSMTSHTRHPPPANGPASRRPP
jgi:signal transduction histidine kinase